ncbi:MAG TPA: M56 family metallopeptidase, partial [Steroidobacteraceae bacterium]|nr:M56 family metallopeptidase [Steroidobacteraceae bacterium]
MMLVLLECAVRSAALIAIVWLTLKVLRVGSVRLERNAWLGVLAASAAMPALSKLAATSAPHAVDVVWLQPVQFTAFTSVKAGAEWSTAVVAIMAAVAAIFVIRHTLGIVRWWRVHRAAVPLASPVCAGFDVRVTPVVNSPATVFSTVLVPVDFETWAPDVQRAVIAHERTHVANRDFYVQWAAQLHRCIFWFNPLAWWLARRLCALSEHISDDAALEATAERERYAEVLLGFAHRVTRSDHILQMAGSRTL